MKMSIEDEDLERFVNSIRGKYIDEIKLKVFKNRTFVVSYFTKEGPSAMVKCTANLRGKVLEK